MGSPPRRASAGATGDDPPTAFGAPGSSLVRKMSGRVLHAMSSRLSSRRRSSAVGPVDEGVGHGIGSPPARPGEAMPAHCQEKHIRMRLDEAHRVGQQFRVRVQLPLYWGGLGLLLASVVAGVALAGLKGGLYAGASFVGAPLGALLVLLSMLPTDDRLVRRALVVGACAWALFAFAVLGKTSMDVDELPPQPGGVCMFGARTMRAEECEDVSHGVGPDPAELKCAQTMGMAVPCWWAAVDVALRGAQALVASVAVAKLCYYRALDFSTRARLDLQWAAHGLTFFHVGLLEIAYLGASAGARLIKFSAGGGLDWAMHWLIALLTAVSGMGIGFVLVHTSMRVRVQAWMAARGEQLSTAAGLAALLGGREAAAVQETAAALFRCVRLCELQYEEMRDGVPNPELYARLSQPARFGHVDAFVSHSWRDDPRGKWEELQAWRRLFVQEHGREPTVWIDKVCIDQSQIEANLTCLPVFLAGCNELLCVCGKSYLSRLWCVIELYTFLEMGGQLKQIKLRTLPCLDRSVEAAAAEASAGVPQATESAKRAPAPQPPAAGCPVTGKLAAAEGGEADALALAAEQAAWVRHFEAFDARAASCLLSSDQERLLMTIEAGFGGFDRFNEKLRSVFVALVRARGARGEAEGRGLTGLIPGGVHSSSHGRRGRGSDRTPTAERGGGSSKRASAGRARLSSTSDGSASPSFSSCTLSSPMPRSPALGPVAAPGGASQGAPSPMCSVNASGRLAPPPAQGLAAGAASALAPAAARPVTGAEAGGGADGAAACGPPSGSGRDGAPGRTREDSVGGESSLTLATDPLSA